MTNNDFFAGLIATSALDRCVLNFNQNLSRVYQSIIGTSLIDRCVLNLIEISLESYHWYITT